MTYERWPWALAWHEVDPRRIPFDAAGAADVIAGLGPAASVPVRPRGHAGETRVIRWGHETGRAWADEMSAAIAAHYGRWASGWRWAHDEGDIGGGPVGAWCCPRDSITTPAETLTRVAAALVEWRGWLEELAAHFDRFPLDDDDRSEQERRDTWEQATASLVTLVVERTGAGDAWYRHCRQVLGWFLARWDFSMLQIDDLLYDAIGGRFQSWITPEPETVQDIARRLAGSLDGEI